MSQGFTQEALAGKLDVSRQAVAKWESGQAYPDISNLIQIKQIDKEHSLKSEFYHCILYIFPVNPENHYFDCFSVTKNNKNNGFSVYNYQIL